MLTARSHAAVRLEQWRLRISYLRPLHHKLRTTLTQLIQDMRARGNTEATIAEATHQWTLDHPL